MNEIILENNEPRKRRNFRWDTHISELSLSKIGETIQIKGEEYESFQLDKEDIYIILEKHEARKLIEILEELLK